MEQRVRAALDAIRPAIQGDGGDVEFIGVDADGVVQVRFQGACVGCPAASITLTQGIERTLKQRVPEVTGVVLA
ncbi:MAG: NifU family protein [bacterium]|nr:NifU family protein [bacterium]